MLLEQNDIQYVQNRNKDEVGRVFLWKGKVFRGISPECEAYVREMLNSGLIQELIGRGMFPNTIITEYHTNDYPLVLEHECIWPVIYPQEWSFSMLKEAALTAIKTGIIARKHGYNMKDAHGLNVLFNGAKPIYVDLGSFIKEENNLAGWGPYEEFLRFYYYPLKIWSHGNTFIAKMSIFSGNLMPHLDYLRYQNPLYRYLPDKLVEKTIKVMRALPKIIAKRLSQLSVCKRYSLLLPVINILNRWLAKRQAAQLKGLVEKVSRISCKKKVTMWDNHHQTSGGLPSH